MSLGGILGARGLRSRLTATVFQLTLSKAKPAGAMLRLGSDYGGWTVPIDELDASWVCYLAGIGEDASFDLAVAKRGCRVVAIDPTPRALSYIEPIAAAEPNLQAVPFAVWIEETELAFYPPESPDHVSYSATNRQRTADPIHVPARTIEQLARELGDDHVDLLKLDIEGAEYPVLASLDLRELGVKVLCVEYHPEAGLKRMRRAVRDVTDQGYTVAAVRRTDVTFCRC